MSEYLSEAELDTFRQELVEEKQSLLVGAAELHEQAQPVELDQQNQGRVSRIDAIQHQHMAQASEQHMVEHIAKIDAALKRIDADDFGLCHQCDEPIAKARLKAMPDAFYCVDCQDKQEHKKTAK